MESIIIINILGIIPIVYNQVREGYNPVACDYLDYALGQWYFVDMNKICEVPVLNM